MSPGSLFQALVVMGASLTAGCGGESTATHHAPDPDAGSGGTGGATGGSGGSTGATGGTGGSTGGSGGSTGATGGTGGSTGGGMGATAGSGGSIGGTGGMAGRTGWLPDLSETSQWDCARQADHCEHTTAGPYASWSSALTLTEPCPVDPSRPRSVTDCAAGETLRCQLARTTMDEQFLVNCECVPMDGCSTCVSLFDGMPQKAVTCTEVLTVCPCAYTGILK
jgi:hypothetical protein